jgi:hypothetical protein
VTSIALTANAKKIKIFILPSFLGNSCIISYSTIFVQWLYSLEFPYVLKK